MILAENLKNLRRQKKLSLDAVSAATGVSKSMLGQIERGAVNPTVSTVWKIANGMKVSFTELLRRAESECEVIRHGELQPLTEDDGRYRNYPVFPYGPQRPFEVYQIEIEPQGMLEAKAHPAGTQELIQVFAGQLEVQTGGITLVAGDGDALRFQADAPHRYRNIGDGLCRLSMVIYCPE